MKKWMGLLCGCLVLSNTCFAYTSCKGGTEITANSQESDKGGLCMNADYCNGRKFCKSNALMSWYASHAWCKANGGKLATRNVACPHITKISNKEYCDNLKNVSDHNTWGFINYRSGLSGYRVNFKTGEYGNTQKLNRAVRNASGKVTTYGGITDMYAFCE